MCVFIFLTYIKMSCKRKCKCKQQLCCWIPPFTSGSFPPEPPPLGQPPYTDLRIILSTTDPETGTYSFLVTNGGPSNAPDAFILVTIAEGNPQGDNDGWVFGTDTARYTIGNFSVNNTFFLELELTVPSSIHAVVASNQVLESNVLNNSICASIIQ